MNGSGTLRISLAQVNPTVGALERNAAAIREFALRAAEEQADLVVFPEMAISGYPPDDLLYRSDFLEAVEGLLHELADELSSVELVAVVGFPERAGESSERPLTEPLSPPAYNSAAVLARGTVAEVYRKDRLPNYGVFDERRHFLPGSDPVCVDVAGWRVGITICEDIWLPGGPASAEVGEGANLLVNCSASPYARGKVGAREALVAERAKHEGTPIALCNLVGGQDELVFDGASIVCSSDGRTLARAVQFEEDLLVCDVDSQGMTESARSERPRPWAGEAEETYSALVTGLRDYAIKNGFSEMVLGLSGGIDSALAVLLAVDAVGPERVHAAVMPSPHSSEETQSDARRIAQALGVDLIELPIADAMSALDDALRPRFHGTPSGLAEENLQARIRGSLVMALSNKFGWLPLATGNKSEMAVGYATLYGDMAGGFAPIKDVPKTLVYELVRWRNAETTPAPIPQQVIERPPTAELRPGQLDVDSLPPYDLLDEILAGYVERAESRAELVARGHPADVVDDVIRLVDRAEYKRRQAPPGTRISAKAFGRDRRLPITNRFDPAAARSINDRGRQA